MTNAKPGTVPARASLPSKVPTTGNIKIDDEDEDDKKIELSAVDKAKLITEDELNEILANSPAPMVTKEYMKTRIVNIEFTRLAGTTTHCQITLDNGYTTSGESACVNVENFNKDAGEKLSYESAFAKLWVLFGFLLKEKQFLKSKA